MSTPVNYTIPSTVSWDFQPIIFKASTPIRTPRPGELLLDAFEDLQPQIEQAVDTAGGGVYTSTEYPAHQPIPLHNEQAYTREWAMRLWFHSVIDAHSGGETPIADSRAIYRDMPPVFRRHFAEGIIPCHDFIDGFSSLLESVHAH